MAKKQRKKTSQRRRTTVAHEQLAPGTQLTATLKSQTFSASVILGSEGKPEIEFDGQRYPSLSAAVDEHAGKPARGNRYFFHE